MACLVALAVTTMVLMAQPGLLTFAARTSPAEAFWRAVLPDAPMPDAILELLHPETNVPKGVKADDDDPPTPVPPMNFNYDDYRALPRTAPSSKVLSRPGVRRAAANDDNAVASSSTVFFLEDAVRVGESLPFRSFQRAAAPAALAPLRLYTVRAVRKVEGSSFVVCRGEAGPSAVYGCRATGPARAYVVDVAGDRGDDAVTTAAAVCHTDTSQWDPEHAAFRLLGVRPGGAAVCHTMPNAQVLSTKNEKSLSA